jgi:hypothetical protein
MGGILPENNKYVDNDERTKTYVLKGGNLRGFFFSLIDDYRE